MSTEDNKEVIRQTYDGENESPGDIQKILSLFEKYLAPGFVNHIAGVRDVGREQMIQEIPTFVTAFPDRRFTIEDMVAEEDTVVARFTMRATHNGAFRGISATGKKFAYEGVEIYKLRGGKIAEMWAFTNMMAQLEAISAPKR